VNSHPLQDRTDPLKCLAFEPFTWAI